MPIEEQYATRVGLSDLFKHKVLVYKISCDACREYVLDHSIDTEGPIDETFNRWVITPELVLCPRCISLKRGPLLQLFGFK